MRSPAAKIFVMSSRTARFGEQRQTSAFALCGGGNASSVGWGIGWGSPRCRLVSRCSIGFYVEFGEPGVGLA